MTDQINSNYLENYASKYASEVCDKFFQERKFISGQDIIGLTNSAQVNFFILKRLFGLWQEELEKLKSNPFFDYRDINVHEALTQFMNVLSKRIKVERSQFEPLLEYAVSDSIKVATDPVSFYQAEISNAPDGHINEYLKENQKYYKWHLPVISFLIDKAGFGLEKEPYLKAIATNYHAIESELESMNLLLATLSDVVPFDLDAYLPRQEEVASEASSVEGKGEDGSFFDSIDDSSKIEERAESNEKQEDNLPKPEKEVIKPVPSPGADGSLNAELLKVQFETESYVGMKSVVGSLSEGVAINQRIMFTRALFDGNPDLLMHALKLIDESGSFSSAISLMNERYVSELNWDTASEPVKEFLQLVYRRFDD